MNNQNLPELTDSAIAGCVQRLVSRLRTPGLKSDVEECVAALYDRVNNPSEYIPEAVADAKHDLRLLAGIEREWSANGEVRQAGPCDSK